MKKLGHWLAAQIDDMSTRELVALVVLNFVAGASLGAFVSLRLGPIATAIFVALCTVGLLWQCVRLVRRHRN